MKKSLLSLFLIFSLFLSGCGLTPDISQPSQPLKSTVSSSSSDEEETSIVEFPQTISDSEMQVHFIDVGQADSILISSLGHYMLVDAGNNEDSNLVVNYLKNEGVSRLDYVIGTHPHEDHIGGMDVVINTFEIGTVIIPPKESTTKTFEDVLDAMMNKGLSATKPVVGDIYTLGDAQFTIIAPTEDFGNSLNDWSVGIKLVNGETTFILCGDAEEPSEEGMLRSGIDLKADVLKLSHHGSSTGTSAAFLNAVNPTYAVISVGEGNSYGHPHKEALNALRLAGVLMYRTDKQGTIVVTSDGKEITWSSSPSTDYSCGSDNEGNQDNKGNSSAAVSPADSPTTSNTYILNTNTKKFHYPSCGSVSKMSEKNKQEYQGTRDALMNQGYSPCGNCKP